MWRKGLHDRQDLLGQNTFPRIKIPLLCGWIYWANWWFINLCNHQKQCQQRRENAGYSLCPPQYTDICRTIWELQRKKLQWFRKFFLAQFSYILDIFTLFLHFLQSLFFLDSLSRFYNFPTWNSLHSLYSLDYLHYLNVSFIFIIFTMFLLNIIYNFFKISSTFAAYWIYLNLYFC